MLSRPIREKTPCSKKSGCLTSTNPDFDFEIGNSDFAVKHVFQRWEFHPQSGSQLRNPTPALIDFYMFCVFPRNPKRISSRRGFNEVNRWLKKISSGFFYENPSWGQIFHCQNPFLLFIFNYKICISKFYSDLPIENTQNFRTIFPVLHKYSQLFWTLLNRNKSQQL